MAKLRNGKGDKATFQYPYRRHSPLKSSLSLFIALIEKLGGPNGFRTLNLTNRPRAANPLEMRDFGVLPRGFMFPGI